MTVPTNGVAPGEVTNEPRRDVLGTVSELAAEIRSTASGGAKIRVAVVTNVQATEGRRVQTDQTGTAWVARLEDTAVYVGDRVALLNEGTLWLMIGRLTGEPGAVPIGSIVSFAGTTAPPGWMKCDGTAVNRTTYATLFAVLGTAYGVGDGSATFNLPNLNGRMPVGTNATYPQATTGGAATVALTTAQMPAHDHGNSGNHEHGIDNAAVTTTVNGTGTTPVASHEPGTTHFEGGHTHSSVGSGSAHENMPPYLSLLYIIRVL